MDELLERHRPGNVIDDEWRGFEWFALWKLLHTEKFTLRHQVSTPTVVYTPDGRTLLTGNHHGVIEKWDARSGQALGQFATYPPGVYQLRFFKAGTRLIVSSGVNGYLSIWDYPNQRKLLELPPLSPDYSLFRFFALSPDETKLVTSVSGLPFQIWDTTTGQLLDTCAVPADFGIPPAGPAIYTPSGRPLCLVRKGKHFELWDLLARRSVVQLDPQSGDPRASLPFDPVGHIFSPDGKLYYLPTEDFRIRVWDFKRGGKPLHILAEHQDHVEIPALSHDGKLLASGSDDRTLRLWDMQTGKLLVTVKNESQTFSPIFSSDDKSLAAVNMRALRTKVWDVQRLLSAPQALDGIQTLELSTDGKMLTYDDSAGPVLRDLQTGRKLLALDKATSLPCIRFDCVKFSADGNLIAIRRDLQQDDRGDVVIMETATGKVLAQLGEHTGYISAVDFSPDGKTFATGGFSDGLIKLWDTATWRVRTTPHGHVGIITSLDFSPDGSRLASSGRDISVKVWDVADGKELFALRGHRFWVVKTRFSPDGKMLASADLDFTIKLWDASTGRHLRTLTGHANSVNCLAFSPDGSRLASAGDDRAVRVWDVKTGEQLTALHGHNDKVWQVFFTRDGRTLISSSEKETRLWRAATEEEARARQ
jgi:WD40 repeat protein